MVLCRLGPLDRKKGRTQGNVRVLRTPCSSISIPSRARTPFARSKLSSPTRLPAEINLPRVDNVLRCIPLRVEFR